MQPQTALITGATSGVGLATAHILAQHGFTLILLCRNELRAQAVQLELRQAYPAAQIELVIADLADLAAVRAAAAQVCRAHPTLDVLLNNAGYIPSRLDYVQGVEQSFYANYIGHFVLTQHLLAPLRAAAARTGDARIINLTSNGYLLGKAARFFHYQATQSITLAYCDSRLAMLLFARELTRRLAGEGIRAYAVHPGPVHSQIGVNVPGLLGRIFAWGGAFMRTPLQGAQTSIFLATAPLATIGEGNSGRYFTDCKPARTFNSDITNDNAAALWGRTLPYA